MKSLFVISFALMLCGCIATGRYSQYRDSAPEELPEHINTEDAKPRYVVYTKNNTEPYEVFGKEYYPLASGKGYVASGKASWYGQKFHGHLTANGEVYDMYEMTAAHRTLPLPSFVKVTNLENNMVAIVKVNDRGPFHNERLIDLSWAAANKLDILQQGTANVKVEVVHVDKEGIITVGDTQVTEIPGKNSQKTEIARHHYIHVAQSDNSESLNELARGLSYLFHIPTETPPYDNGYVLRLGPIEDDNEVENILSELKENGFIDAKKVVLSL